MSHKLSRPIRVVVTNRPSKKEASGIIENISKKLSNKERKK